MGTGKGINQMIIRVFKVELVDGSVAFMDQENNYNMRAAIFCSSIRDLARLLKHKIHLVSLTKENLQAGIKFPSEREIQIVDNQMRLCLPFSQERIREFWTYYKNA